MEFTKTAVAAAVLPPGKTEHFEWDEDLPGFGIRFREGGSKTWCVQYRVGRQARRESLGDVRKVSLEDARKIARQRFAKVELGIDPGAERAARARAQLTLGKGAARYLDAKRGTLRPSTYQQAERHFTVLWRPLLDQPLDAIKRADVAARLQEIVKAHGRTAAARARGNLSALFVWAAKEGMCDANPVALTNDPSEGIKARERVLSDDEIAAVWRACQDDDFSRIVQLLILLGCRREEIGQLKWDEANLDTGIVIIPGARTKNGRELQLALPPAALDILRSAKPPEGRAYVFGRHGNSGFAGWAWGKLNLDHHIARVHGKPLAHWTLHDLRRTMRTGLGRLGIPPHVAELAINHAKGGIQAVYDKHTYQPQIAAALAAWAAHVMEVVGETPKSKKIVPIHA